MTTTDRKPKVLFLLPNMVGHGGQRAVFNLFRSLDRERVQPVLFAQERLGEFLADIDNTMDFRFALERPYRRTDMPRLLLETIRHARDADVIVGGLEGRAAFFGLVAAKLLRKPVVLWLHIDWGPFLKVVSWRQRLAIRSYGFADRVIACSQGVADSFVKLFSVDPSRVEAIYNGIPCERILKASAEPLPEDATQIFKEPTVLMVGRLHHQKGYDYLIKAHALLTRRGIKHNLAIIGVGELQDELEKLADDLGVKSTVHWLGFQSNPYKFMKHATVFALPSRFEGFGLVVVEAMLCGAPVVSANCPSGPAEILDDGKYGILVEPENPEALADGIQKLLEQPEERARLASLARDHAPAFDERRLTRRWEDLFQSLMKPARVVAPRSASPSPRNS